MTPADSHAIDPNTIVCALDAEVSTLIIVLDMLEIEHEALLGSCAERLEQAVVAKQKAIKDHVKARSEREELGLKEALKEQITSHPTLVNGLRERAESLVEELSNLAVKSKNLNSRNGQLIAGLKERTTASLKVLRPEVASVSLYGDSGSAENTMGSRLLGSA